MLARLRKSQEENEGGFTLIELLVVIIIIGILAAIAIPVFLNQCKKGYDAQAKSDLRNAATLEETYLTDYNVYGTNTNIAFGKSGNVSAVIATPTGATGYLMSNNSDAGQQWCYDSAQPAGKTGVYKGSGTGTSTTASTTSGC
ncbi:MAG: prepilin-type N-terminal cleavage/methylation domain-containing protein [Gemmatimonadaceae bacterium]